MAEFKAFAEHIEVNATTVLSFIYSMKRGQDKRLALLEKHGITPEEGGWYPQQKWLDAFQELSQTVGDMNLLLIGMAIIENAEFPPFNSLKEGLQAIDVAYHMNHRNQDGQPLFNPDTGEKLEGIGCYDLQYYNEEEQTAIMYCRNPYPSKFDQGIITALCRRVRPDSIKTIDVRPDLDKERRPKGGDSCTFIINW